VTLLGLLLCTAVAFTATAYLLFRFAWKPLLSRLEGQGASPEADPATVELQRAPSSERCPFCHDALADAGVACTTCFARHHEECWDSHQACAACGNSERYAGVERTAGRRPPLREGPK
jgi:hypothetical protein